MSTLTKPYTFTANTFAVASQVNSDFDTLYNWVNGGGAMWNDGSTAFTNVPSGPASDPSSANQLARKAYVDGRMLVNLNASQWPAGQQLRIDSYMNFPLTYTAGVSGTPISFSQFFDLSPVVFAFPAPSAVTMTTVFVVSSSTSGFNVRIFNGGTEIPNGTVCNISFLALGN